MRRTAALLLGAGALVATTTTPAGTAPATAAPAVLPATHTMNCEALNKDLPPGPPSRLFGYTFPSLAVACAINEERARHGLPQLEVNNALMVAANNHAQAAVDLKWWGPGQDSHKDPRTNSTPVSRIRAAGYCPNGTSWKVNEVTYNGWGGAGTPRAAVNWWVNISTYGHREIVLDPTLKEIGPAARGGAAYRSGASATDAGTYVVTFGSCTR